MRSLIVEDEFISRALLLEFLAPYGPCNVAVDGDEALQAVDAALANGTRYDLICLDIMMPGIDGTEVLARIREMESEAGILLGDGAKVFMTTALGDSKNVRGAFKASCDAYLVKPVKRSELEELVREHLTAPARS
jgi:two-component system chemotaxis response regulator CheY